MRANRMSQSFELGTLNIDEIVQDTFQLSNMAVSHGASSSSDEESGMGSQSEFGRRRTPPFEARGQAPRPQIILRYTQSIDGSLVALGGAHALDLDHPSALQLINRY